jgi:hypothetical protein
VSDVDVLVKGFKKIGVHVTEDFDEPIGKKEGRHERKERKKEDMKGRYQ